MTTNTTTAPDASELLAEAKLALAGAQRDYMAAEDELIVLARECRQRTSAEATYPRQTDPLAQGVDFLDIANKALAPLGLRVRVWWAPEGSEQCSLRAEVDRIGQDAG